MPPLLIIPDRGQHTCIRPFPECVLWMVEKGLVEYDEHYGPNGFVFRPTQSVGGATEERIQEWIQEWKSTLRSSIK
jgi:hypothetical protein